MEPGSVPGLWNPVVIAQSMDLAKAWIAEHEDLFNTTDEDDMIGVGLAEAELLMSVTNWRRVVLVGDLKDKTGDWGKVQALVAEKEAANDIKTHSKHLVLDENGNRTEDPDHESVVIFKHEIGATAEYSEKCSAQELRDKIATAEANNALWIEWDRRLVSVQEAHPPRVVQNLGGTHWKVY